MEQKLMAPINLFVFEAGSYKLVIQGSNTYLVYLSY